MHCSLFDHKGKVCSDKSVRRVCVLVEINILGERNIAGVDLENFFASLFVRHTDLNLSIEPASPPQSRIN